MCVYLVHFCPVLWGAGQPAELPHPQLLQPEDHQITHNWRQNKGRENHCTVNGIAGADTCQLGVIQPMTLLSFINNLVMLNNKHWWMDFKELETVSTCFPSVGGCER